jgi:hypothetical protein
MPARVESITPRSEGRYLTDAQTRKIEEPSRMPLSDPRTYPRLSAEQKEQTTSKFPFRWWGVNSTLSGKHQLHRPPGRHNTEEEALDA